MDHLWAPWRINYIHCKKKDEGCIFCNKPKEKKDKKNYILERTKHGFVLFNIYPYNNGHLMIAPYRHISNLSELTKKEAEDIFNLLKKWEIKLTKALKPQAFNIGVNTGRSAGAGFEHLHFHIVPRWQGDCNFMPVISDTKILNMSLDELYKILVRGQASQKL